MTDSGARDAIDGVNDVARLCRTLSLTFLFAALLIIAMAVSADDETLLRETPLSLPPFNLPVSVVGFFATAPWVIVVLHAHLLLKLKVLYERMEAIDPDVLTAQRDRLFPYEILLFETRADSAYRTLLRVWLTALHLALPLAALLYLQLEFLDYQSEFITMTQRAALMAELGVLYFLLKGYRWPFGAIERPPVKMGLAPALMAGVFIWTLGAALTGSAGAATGVAAVAVTALVAAALPIRPRFTAGASALLVVAGLACVHGGNADKAIASLTAPFAAPRDLEGSDGLARLWRDTRVLDLSGKTLVPETVTPTVLARLVDDPDFAAKWSTESLGLDLRGRKLRGAILDDTNLIAARLSDGENETDLTGASLRRAVLRHATLTRANLEGADLSRSTMTGANLSSATTAGANLNGATLTRADLSFATMTGADLSFATMTGAGLSFAKITGADLFRSTMAGADLSFATMTGADLTNATMTGTDLSFAKMTGTDLSGATMTGADLSEAYLSHANIHLIKFPRDDEYLESTDAELEEISNEVRRQSTTERLERALTEKDRIVEEFWKVEEGENVWANNGRPLGHFSPVSAEPEAHASEFAKAVWADVCASRAAAKSSFKRLRQVNFIFNTDIQAARDKALARAMLSAESCPALDDALRERLERLVAE